MAVSNSRLRLLFALGLALGAAGWYLAGDSMPEAARFAAAGLGKFGLLLAFFAMCVLLFRGGPGYRRTKGLDRVFDGEFRPETRFENVTGRISAFLFLCLCLVAGWFLIGLRLAEK
jgi:hypothetical protein